MPCLLGTCGPQPAPCASPANRGHILPSFLHILSFLRISGDPLPPWVQTPHPTGTPAPICASTPAPPVPIPVLGSQPAWASIPRLGLTPFPAACNVPPPLGGNPTMSGPPFPSAAHPTDWPGSMSVAHGPPAHQAPADSEPTCSSFSSGSSSQRAATGPPWSLGPRAGWFPGGVVRGPSGVKSWLWGPEAEDGPLWAWLPPEKGRTAGRVLGLCPDWLGRQRWALTLRRCYETGSGSSSSSSCSMTLSWWLSVPGPPGDTEDAPPGTALAVPRVTHQHQGALPCHPGT